MAKKLHYKNNILQKNPTKKEVLQAIYDIAVNKNSNAVARKNAITCLSQINKKSILNVKQLLKERNNEQHGINIYSKIKPIKTVNAQEKITIGLYGEIANNPKYQKHIRNGAASKLNNYASKYGTSTVSNIIKSVIQKKKLSFTPYIPYIEKAFNKNITKQKQHKRNFRLI